MSGSKLDFLDRLRREGRWREFICRREALKAQGTAVGDAWRIVAAELPAPAPEPPEIEHWPALKPAAITNYGVAVDWVFDNLGRPIEEMDWDNCPGSGALGMLRWARSSEATRGLFYTQFASKRLPPKSTEAEQEAAHARSATRAIVA